MARLDRWWMRTRLAIRRFRLRFGRQGLFALRPSHPEQMTPGQRWLHRVGLQLVAAAAMFAVLALLARVPGVPGQVAARSVRWLVITDTDFAGLAQTASRSLPWSSWVRAAGLNLRPATASVPTTNLTTGPRASTDGPLPTEMGPLVLPLQGRIMASYGWQNDGSTPHYHRGLDLEPVDQTATQVRAIAAGLVAKVGNDPNGLGSYVLLAHVGGWTSRYASLQRTTVTVGQQVVQGGVIGSVGKNSESSQAHLHFELLHNGQQVDPAPYLPPLAKGP